METSVINGFDPDWFVEQAGLDDVFCSICLSVVNDPFQCRNGHMSCRRCIVQYLQIKQECPTCKCKLSSEKLGLNLFVKNAVARMHVKCTTSLNMPENSMVCDWKGELFNLDLHLVSCMFAEVLCVNCNTKVQKRHLQEHDEHHCPKMMIKCKYCNLDIMRQELEGHLSTSCLFMRVECSNGCGENVLRGELSHHLSWLCAQQAVFCQFEGCGIRTARCNITNHNCECHRRRDVCATCKLC